MIYLKVLWLSLWKPITCTKWTFLSCAIYACGVIGKRGQMYESTSVAFAKLLSESEYHVHTRRIRSKCQKRSMFRGNLKDWIKVVNWKVCLSSWITKFGIPTNCWALFFLSSFPFSNSLTTLQVKNSNICSGQEQNVNKQSRWILRKRETGLFYVPNQDRGNSSPTKWALSHYPQKIIL